MDLLRATLPVGTLSGAPKVRAIKSSMSWSLRKGVFLEGLWVISLGMATWTAIAIRTGIIKDQVLYVQAGAGVVADSIAENEWQETINKARSILSCSFIR